MKSLRYLASLLFVFFVIPFTAFAEKVATMPAPSGYVNDYAKVLSDSSKSDMEAIANEVHTKTRAQVFLVTINTLDGEDVEKFTNELFNKWKIGEKKTDRGVLILFAIQDHKRWIEVGYGFEGILNDAKVGDIGREMVPALRAQDYDGATKLGLTKVANIIAADSNVTLDTVASTPDAANEGIAAEQPQHSSAPNWVILTFPLLILGAPFLFFLWFFVRSILGLIRGDKKSGSRWTWGSGGSGGSSFDDSSSSGSDDSFSGGDGGSSGGGGAGGDW